MLSLKDFIDDNIEDIDDGKWAAVFQDAWEMMSKENVDNLLFYSVLSSLNRKN